MKLVLEMTSHSGDGSIVYHAVENFPATIGRGYHNNVILSDPHISASHLRIEYDGENWHAQDLGSDNGLFINEKPCNADRVQISSGDLLRIGRTELRVFSPAHPVQKTLPLQKTSPVFLWLSRPRNIWLSFLTALGVITGWTYLEVWSEQIGFTLSVAAGSAGLCIILWAALWSVAGRLIKHKTHFLSHLALASLYITGSTFLWYVQAYLDFLTSENFIAVISSYAFNMTATSLLLYGALSLATDLSKKKRALCAFYFSAGVGISIFALGHVGTLDFSADPHYPATMEPYLARLAPGETLDDFMKDNETLFHSEIFVEKIVKPLKK